MKLFKYYSKVVQWTDNKQKVIVKQLIATATPLLIPDAPEAIYYARAIFDFTILAQYLLHNNKTLFYMEHALYRLNKTKIAFENHCLINIKPFRPIFNSLKFHTIMHFVQCIWDYGNTINYNTVHSEIMYKYLLKAFYRRTNKKKYKSQILEYNIRHTNVIILQSTILIAKVPVGSVNKKELIVNTLDAEVTQVYIATNVLLKYN